MAILISKINNLTSSQVDVFVPGYNPTQPLIQIPGSASSFDLLSNVSYEQLWALQTELIKLIGEGILSSAGTFDTTSIESSGGTPAGADTQIQYNSSGAFGASPALTFDGSTLTIDAGAGNGTTINSTTGALSISGGTIQIDPISFNVIFGTNIQLATESTASFDGDLTFIALGTRYPVLNLATSGSAVFTNVQIQESVTADPSSVVDIQSTTAGFLSPRMTTVQRDAIASPATGLEIFNTTTNQIEFYNGTIWGPVGSSTPAGANTQIQFNNSGAFGASSNLTWDGTTFTTIGIQAQGLTVNGEIAIQGGNDLIMFDSTNTNFIEVMPPVTVDSGGVVWVLPGNVPSAGQSLKVLSGSGNVATLEWA